MPAASSSLRVLMIDGKLVRGRAVGDAYLSALAASAELARNALSADHEPGFRHLSRRLIQHGIPYDYEQPELVTARLASILGVDRGLHCQRKRYGSQVASCPTCKCACRSDYSSCFWHFGTLCHIRAIRAG